MTSANGSRLTAHGTVILSVAVALLAYPSDIVGTAQRSGTRIVNPAARLLIGDLVRMGDSGDPIDAIVKEERQRLVSMCGPLGSHVECDSRNAREARREIGVLYSRPDAKSKPVAHVYGVVRGVRRDEGGEVRAALVIEDPEQRGTFRTLIEDLGDWGYSCHIDGMFRRAGNWVELLPPLVPKNGWLPGIESLGNQPRTYPKLFVWVDSLAGHIVELRPLRARTADGRMAMIESESYYIASVRNGVVRFRREIDSDSKCKSVHPFNPPQPIPPILTAPASEFFDAEGTPRLRTKYTRGC